MAVSAGDVARDRTHSCCGPGPHVIVLFGATGDLARRKLLPGLFHLGQAGLLPESSASSARRSSELDDEGFRELRPRRAATSSAASRSPTRSGQAFSARLSYVPLAGADALAAGVGAAPRRRSASEARRLHYL